MRVVSAPPSPHHTTTPRHRHTDIHRVPWTQVADRLPHPASKWAQFGTAAELRAAASEKFPEDGRAFTAGIGGGRQKYTCSGEPPLPKREKKTKPGDLVLVEPVLAMPTTRRCKAEVRATKSCAGEWRVTHANFEHVNCSGGDARARLCGINPLVKSTVSANHWGEGAQEKPRATDWCSSLHAHRCSSPQKHPRSWFHGDQRVLSTKISPATSKPSSKTRPVLWHWPR